MKRMFKKIMTFALSAMLATQVFAVGASANAGELFIDTPVDKDGKTSVMVANFTEETQKVRLFSAKRESGMLKEVSISDEVTLAAGSGAELVTELPVVGYEHFIWSDALVPYDKDAVALPAPTNLKTPATRDSASNHRTLAYNSFILEWDVDKTGVVDHYEIYEDGTYLDKTNQGYYIVYSDDINADSKSYTVKAVTVGGKESAVSAAVTAGTLYMNEMDFSNMEVATAETSFDVTYPWIESPTDETNTTETHKVWLPTAAKYGTEEDIRENSRFWVDETNCKPNATKDYTGIESTGMKLMVGKWEQNIYMAPAKIAADETIGREERSAFKTYYSYNYNANTSKDNPRTYDGGARNSMYFTITDDYLTVDGELQNNVTFAYDYLDNGTGKLGGRYKTSTNPYMGKADFNKTNTGKWMTSEAATTTYASSVAIDNFDGVAPKIRITDMAAAPTGNTDSKLYISGIRAWLTDRKTDLTSAQKIQTATGQFAGVETIDTTKGITPVWISGESQRRGVSDMATNSNAGACQTVGKGENRVGFNVADTYLGKYDKNVTIEFEYNNPNKNSSTTYIMTLTYQDKDGNSKTVTKDVVGGTGTIKFDLNDAGFSNGLINNTCDFTISPGATTDNLYIRNMKVHASNSVR